RTLFPWPAKFGFVSKVLDCAGTRGSPGEAWGRGSVGLFRTFAMHRTGSVAIGLDRTFSEVGLRNRRTQSATICDIRSKSWKDFRFCIRRVLRARARVPEAVAWRIPMRQEPVKF